jgi:tetratricopeptide (TPR) repeat protein
LTRKSATSARYCGVWWIRAQTPETLIDDLVALGARLIPGLGDMKPEDAALRTVDQLAQMRTEKPWLLVYDNAEAPAALRNFTPANNADVLVTTRRTDWHGEADDELAVDVFDRETAIAYLLAHARNGGAEAAGRLADALQCLPLALSHARAYCWDRNLGFDRYIALLAEVIGEKPKDARYPHSVFVTFNLAVERAAEKCAEAETLMALLAFFAPDKIPLWLVPDDVLSGKQRGDALAALTSVSLVAYDSSSDGAPAVSVHRLVQEVMRGRLRAAGRFEDMAALAILLLNESFDSSGSFEAPLHNATWIAHAAAAIPNAPESGDAAYNTVWTLIQMGDFRVMRGDLSGALEAYEFGRKIAAAVARSQPANAQWQRDLSVSYNKLGDVLVAQGNLPEALKSLQDSLAIAERLAKADHNNAGWQRDVAVSHSKLADIIWKQGETGKARDELAAGREIMVRMTKLSPDNATWKRDLAWFEAQIAALGAPRAPTADAEDAREENKKRGLFGWLRRKG